MAHRIGVCSWSLAPSSPDDLVERLASTGVRHVQLALDPIRTGAWSLDDTVAALDGAKASILSGMMAMDGEDYSTLESIRASGGVRPDATWPTNRDAAAVNAGLARQLGLDLVTFHAGFLPHEPCAEREVLVGRLRELVDVFAEQGVRTGFETGQESADTMAAVLADIDRPGAVGVNFDPANMVLYAMGNPVDALETLAEHVVQIHVKDARATDQPGTWGREVPAGQGDVDWARFFDVVDRRELDVDVVIEREAGAARVADIRGARELVVRHLAERGREVADA